MSIYDLIVAVRARMPVYPGDPPVGIDTPLALANGDSANVSRLRLGAHTGTHADASAHFLAEGRRVIDLPLDTLIGEAPVIEIPESVRAIGPEHVTDAMVAGAERVLFKTRNSSFWAEERFREDFTFITPEAARALVAAGVRLVGIDSLSVEVFRSANHDTHKVLPAGNVIVLEGLDLNGIAPGVYELLCLPLKLDGGAGDVRPHAVCCDGTISSSNNTASGGGVKSTVFIIRRSRQGGEYHTNYAAGSDGPAEAGGLMRARAHHAWCAIEQKVIARKRQSS